MSRVIILGAGFGGISTAVELRGRVGSEHSITLVDRGDTFMMGLRKLWSLTGIDSLANGTRPLTNLEHLGIDVVQSEILRIDPAARSVETNDGSIEGDFLVVALGAESRPDLVPGLAEHSHNVWKASNVPAATEQLQALESGRILILVAGAPYPCPPAPYECAMLIDEYLRKAGRRDAVTLDVATLQPMLMPNAGREGSDWIAAQLSEREIGFETGKRINRVEAGQVVCEDGSLPFDLLIAVPPHRPPAIVSESGLVAESGWIAVDQGTLETEHPGVYAIGDVTQIRLGNGLPLPKAGVIAEMEGARVAVAIANQIHGQPPAPAFDGHGYCFIELGSNAVAKVEGDFFAFPEPRVAIVDAASGGPHPKQAFESERLTRWFGA